MDVKKKSLEYFYADAFFLSINHRTINMIWVTIFLCIKGKLSKIILTKMKTPQSYLNQKPNDWPFLFISKKVKKERMSEN